MPHNCSKSRRIHGIYIRLLIGLVIVGSLNALPMGRADKDDGTLYYGVSSLLVDLDPQYAWDSASIDVIDQVCEGLLGYNLSDPDLAIVPVLATGLGEWNEDATNYTLHLRNDVTFHDGNEFDGNDVKWTFDRLTWLIENESTQIAELYAPIDEKILVNQTVVDPLDPYTVTFVLNYPYVPFEALLCFSGSYILSDESTPSNKTLDSETDILVGTGPYKYILQAANFTLLEACENWWNAASRPSQYIEHIVWKYYSNRTAMQQDFLAGNLDWIDDGSAEFLNQYIESPDIYVDQQRKGTVILYLGINNDDVPRKMRQAISWAVDYDYLIEEINQGNAARLTSPVPEGISYHNPNLAYPTYNVTHARQILINAGMAPGAAVDHLGDDAYWTALAASESPIANYTYSWIEGNSLQEATGELVKSNLAQIGIFVGFRVLTWGDIIVWPHTDQYAISQLWMLGWGPDYNDPNNYISPLFSNSSASNHGKVNDPHLQALMAEGLVEPDPGARCDLYYEMQEYIVDDLVPCVFLFVGNYYGYWSMELNGIQRNPMGKIDFASINWQGMPDRGITETITAPDDTAGDGQSSAGIQLVGWGAGMMAIFGVSAIWVLVKKSQQVVRQP